MEAWWQWGAGVLYGQSSSNEYGNAIALSQDGNRLVVGSRSENGHTGAMRIYQQNDGMAAGAATAAVSWSLMEGGLVSGQNPSERAGWSVSILADGNGEFIKKRYYCLTGGTLLFLTNTSFLNLSHSGCNGLVQGWQLRRRIHPCLQI